MVERKTELGLIKIFRGYCGFVLVYFLGFFVYTAYTQKVLYSSSLNLFYINLATFAVLYGYLSWVWLEKKLSFYYFPIAIIISTIVPVFSTTYLWPFDLWDSMVEVVFRSWYLFPILVVPFTLVAWQYGYRIAFVYGILTSIYDLPFIVIRIDEFSIEIVHLLGVPILRTIALSTVGIIVGLLMDTQRRQRRELLQANIQLSHYAETIQELAVSRERNRLARELHDTLAHTLSSQILTLEALRYSPPSDQLELNETLEQMVGNARQGLSETRRALKDLRVKQLEELGLEQSLILLAQDAASKTHAETDLDIHEGIPVLPSEIEHCIYRTAQEGIENIIRHSSATKIGMSLQKKNKEIIFQLTDNGGGFESDAINQDDKHGLKGMKERAHELNGKLQITSRKKHGTKILLQFKVNNDPYHLM